MGQLVPMELEGVDEEIIAYAVWNFISYQTACSKEIPELPEQTLIWTACIAASEMDSQIFAVQLSISCPSSLQIRHILYTVLCILADRRRMRSFSFNFANMDECLYLNGKWATNNPI